MVACAQAPTSRSSGSLCTVPAQPMLIRKPLVAMSRSGPTVRRATVPALVTTGTASIASTPLRTVAAGPPRASTSAPRTPQTPSPIAITASSTMPVA